MKAGGYTKAGVSRINQQSWVYRIKCQLLKKNQAVQELQPHVLRMRFTRRQSPRQSWNPGFRHRAIVQNGSNILSRFWHLQSCVVKNCQVWWCKPHSNRETRNHADQPSAVPVLKLVCNKWCEVKESVSAIISINQRSCPGTHTAKF